MKRLDTGQQRNLILDIIAEQPGIFRSNIIALMMGHGLAASTTHKRLVELREWADVTIVLGGRGAQSYQLNRGGDTR